jgi:hypothetical protein
MIWRDICPKSASNISRLKPSVFAVPFKATCKNCVAVSPSKATLIVFCEFRCVFSAFLIPKMFYTSLLVFKENDIFFNLFINNYLFGIF